MLQAEVATFQLNDPSATVTGLVGRIINQTDGTTTPADIVPAGGGSWGVYCSGVFKVPGPNEITIEIGDQQGDTTFLKGKSRSRRRPSRRPSQRRNLSPSRTRIPIRTRIPTRPRATRSSSRPTRSARSTPAPCAEACLKVLPPSAKPAQQGKFQATLKNYQQAKEKYDRNVVPKNARIKALADLLNDPELRSRFGLDSPQNRRVAFLGQMVPRLLASKSSTRNQANSAGRTI